MAYGFKVQPVFSQNKKKLNLTTPKILKADNYNIVDNSSNTDNTFYDSILIIEINNDKAVLVLVNFS